MARDSGAQRTDYGSKAGEGQGKDKEISRGSADMLKAGGSGSDSGSSGPTGSSRSYPKGGKVSMTPDFNPMNDKKRGGTDWVVGGV
jgi:hypothetical protein